MIDHRSYVLNLSSWENKGIRTHDPCNTSAVLLPTEL